MSSSFPLSASPRCVVLRSKQLGNNYLRSVHDESQGGGVVELSSDGGVMDPRCRFYLEPSKEHDGLMHVRCCYNNKYWVAQQRGGSRWIIATADEPEEDLSKPSCTLLKHIPIAIAGEEKEEEEGGGSTCRFLHSQLGKYVGVLSTSSDTSTTHPCLHLAQEEADKDHKYPIDQAFTAFDVTRRRQLPSHVAFKGFNGYFLGAAIIDRRNYLQFSRQEMDDPTALQIVSTNRDGVVRIRSNSFGMFWRRSPNWIWADSNDTTHNNRDTLFRVTTREDFIALQNLGNNNFCQRLTLDGKTSCLNAAAPSIAEVETRLQIYEPVRSREIYDVHFNLKEAKIYHRGIDGLYDQIVRNETSTTNRSTLSFTYTNTVESRWTSTVSMKPVINIKLRSGIPFVVDGKVEVNTEFNGSYTWGNSETVQQQVTREFVVDVPPMKKVTVRAIATNGICDVPFSYKQRDILTNGKEVINDFTDGMYFGVRTSSMTFHPIEEDL